MSDDKTVTGRRDGRSGKDVPVPLLGLRLCHYAEAGLLGTYITTQSSGSLGRQGTLAALSLDERASRVHASLERRQDGALWLTDGDSKNGTFVNRVRLTAPQQLHSDDVIRIGNTVFVVETITEPTRHLEQKMAGQSAAFCATLAELRRLAKAPLPILLVGETGSGKEVFARFIHQHSGASGELVAINCAAIPESLFESEVFGHQKGAFSGAVANKAGLVEQAHGGTIFLDELGELPPLQQAKLLRFLESGEYTPLGGTTLRKSTARVVAATHVRVDQAHNPFRRDLYARLSAGLVRVPSLRERRSDILLLADHFLQQFAPGMSVHQLSVDTLEVLCCHHWPLNVRQLRSLMQRIALANAPGEAASDDFDLVRRLLGEDESSAPPTVSAPALTREEAPPSRGPKKRVSMTEAEFTTACHELAGNVVQLAKRFSVERRQIYRWFEKFGIDPDTLRKKD